MNIEREIKETFSEWIAFSGTRSGAPLKSRKDIYPLIRIPDYPLVLDGETPVTKEDFNAWHKFSAEKMHDNRPEMAIGWTTKLINLYLKSMVYLGGYGREGLIDLIHPPLDTGLWKGIKEETDDSIRKLTHYRQRIKDIGSYADYEIIIKGFERFSLQKGIRLIEVEKYWLGTKF